MNSQAVRVPRSTKQISVFADLQKRDQRAMAPEDMLLRRWERIAKQEIARG